MDPEQLATVLDEVRGVANEAKDLVTSIQAEKNAWQNELKQLKEHVDAVKADGGLWDKEALETAIADILTRQSTEVISQRVLYPHEQQDLKLPDPWVNTQTLGLPEDVDPYFFYEDVDPKSLVPMDKGPRAYHEGMRMLASVPPLNEPHKMYSRMADDVRILHLLGSLTSKQGQYEGFQSMFPKTSKKWAWYQKRFIESIHGKATANAMDLTDVANWVPTGWSSELRELILLRLTVASLFERIQMPQNPWKIPVDLTDTLGNVIAETTTNASPYADDDVQILVDALVELDAKKLRARLITSGELEEDSIVAMLGIMRRKIVRIMANSQEKALIDGQLTATIDTGDDPAGTTDCRLAFDGLRYFCSAGVANSLVDFSTAISVSEVIKDMRLEMGEYAAETDNLVYIFGIAGMLKMLVQGEVLTVDKYGPAATVLKGELARIGGVPIVVSRYVREDLNAAGIYDGITKTNTICLLVNKEGFIIGDRREMSLEAERLIVTDQYQIVAFQRMDFKPVFGLVRKLAAVGYNFPSA